jgi:hypothetical protein
MVTCSKRTRAIWGQGRADGTWALDICHIESPNWRGYLGPIRPVERQATTYDHEIMLPE